MKKRFKKKCLYFIELKQPAFKGKYSYFYLEDNSHFVYINSKNIAKIKDLEEDFNKFYISKFKIKNIAYILNKDNSSKFFNDLNEYQYFNRQYKFNLNNLSFEDNIAEIKDREKMAELLKTEPIFLL